jgi:hypothetical protein
VFLLRLAATGMHEDSPSSAMRSAEPVDRRPASTAD